ncbi:hypothetical protein ACN95_08115 [Gordonia sihwensis]|uniref:hypothetical protein n=1 Tax=Gordonia sihwensis TaxID=173559 RepID=UPI001C92F2C0|nr:hypothetical protein [Gordonia sihwensis]MBY4569982.1 hypothetical protein [Gordonia sihwensis]
MWPADRYGLIWRGVALDSGVTEREIREAVRRHTLIPVGRGVYVTRESLGPDPGQALRDRYRLRCVAAAVGTARDCGNVLSHESAAAVLGLETLRPDLTSIHLTNGRSNGGHRRPHRVIHSGGLRDDEVVEVNGLTVTSISRTAVDVALSVPDFPRALSVMDSALRLGADRGVLLAELARPRRGVARARRALRHADGRSDNPGESWGRAQMIEAGLPVPELQTRYRLPSGRTAICDYDWDGSVVAEFDGFGKYRREMRKPDQSADDVVIAEKLREDELRALDLHVVRWTTEHLASGQMVPLLRRQLSRFGILPAV